MAARSSANRIAEKKNYPLQDYLDLLVSNLKTGRSTEHTHRPALVTLFESLVPQSRALNEPTREKYGAPDLIVLNGDVPIGYMECKDIGVSLDSTDSIEQLDRYKANLGSIIHTDYLEFRWYQEGELVLQIEVASRIGTKLMLKENAAWEIKNLFTKFYESQIATIKTSRELATKLASTSRMIRQLIQSTLNFDDPDSKWMRRWKDAFQETLFKAIDDKQFADMFAQTLAYGFFSARMQAPDAKFFSRMSAGHVLPKTNPFLRKLFIQFAGPDMPGCINWAVDELVKMLRHTDRDAIEREFQATAGKSDPILHFYETFLREYDNQLKVDKGVFYTPQPIVDFIVRSVDHILSTKMSKTDGLANDETIILDPAVGTGSFLKSAIETIYSKKKSNQGAWESYVNESLLNRIYGFEVLMAPYSVAHLKIGLHLQSTGYKFSGEKRLGIFLTNTLEETQDVRTHLFIEALAQESVEAAKVKNEEPVMVILGNPPYKGASKNRGEWILELIKEYKKDLNERKVNLDDDFIKFMRFAQWKIDKTGTGILAMITNNIFLDGITHRQMRKSLMSSFDELYILNLHGSVQKRDTCDDGSPDENVFDIPLGVSITFMVKSKEPKDKKHVFYSSLKGTREFKYDTLKQLKFADINWTKLSPHGKLSLFLPRNSNSEAEFQSFPSLTECFSQNSSGIQTKRDDVAIAFTEDELKDTLRAFATDDEAVVRTTYELPEDGRDWKLPDAQKHAQRLVQNWSPIVPVLYRPFDVRFTVMDGKSKGFVAYPRYETMKHFRGGQNLGLVTVRQLSLDKYQHAWVTRHAIDGNTISMQSREYNYVMPLYLEPSEDDLIQKRRLNFTPMLLTYLEKFKDQVSPEEIFFYIYAITRSTSYAERYNDMLKSDFARIPLNDKPTVVRRIGRYGQLIAKLDLSEFSPALSPVKFPVAGDNKVMRYRYDAGQERFYINETQYFEHVTAPMREAMIGGFNFFDRWMKSFKGRSLTYKNVEDVIKACFSVVRSPDVVTLLDGYIDRLGGFSKLSTYTILKTAAAVTPEENKLLTKDREERLTKKKADSPKKRKK